MAERGSNLPEYLPYLSMVFKMTVTAVILFLAGWVVYTIKTTSSLHKPHYTFVANLLISDMINTLSACMISGGMMINYQLGVDKPFINCTVMKLRLIPFLVSNMSLLALAVDRLIAIVYIDTHPFKYKKIMTPCVANTIITGTWLLALLPAVYEVVADVDGYIAIPKYGTCIVVGAAYHQVVLLLLFPITTILITTVVLNVLFAFKTYQVHRKIARETWLTGIDEKSERIIALKNVQRMIRKNMKPTTTLLAVVWSSILASLVFVVLYVVEAIAIDSQVFLDYLDLIILANSGYLIYFTDALAYGLYFKQVREPIMNCLKRFMRLNKVNSVAPQQTSTW